MIKPNDLIKKVKEALDNKWGYIMYMTHEMWSEARQQAYNQKYANDSYCDSSKKYGSKWYGHWVTDCSGLIKWAMESLGGKMYHGATTMYNSWCTSKGTFKSGKRTDGKELKPGTALFTGNDTTKNHVGLYIGDGKVIEAAGTQQGVIESKSSLKKWTYWGELKGVDYAGSGGGDEPTPTPTPVPTGKAVVTGTKVALREGPSKNCNVLIRVDEGQTVDLASDPTDWTRVTYNGKTGYMMNKFLRKG